jgi:hypothetical protein
MVYRILDPLARPRRFNLLERERNFRLIEGDRPRQDQLHLDDETSGPADVFGDEAADDRDAMAGVNAKDPFKPKDPASQPLPSVRRPENPPARTPLKTAPPKKGGGVMGGSWIGPGATKDFATDLVKGGDAKSGIGRALGWDKNSTLISRAQDTLDVVGVIDPTGVADATNALGYLAQGKFGDAAVSAAGIVPYVGDVGKLGKWGARGAKTAKRAKIAGKEARLSGKGATIGGRAAAKGAEAGGKVATKTSRFAKAKELYGRGKALFGRAKGAHGKIQDRKASRGQEAPPPPPPQRSPGEPEGAVGKLKGAYARLQAFRQARKAKSQDQGAPPSQQRPGEPEGAAEMQRKLPGDDKPQDTASSRPAPPQQTERPQSAPDELAAPPSAEGDVKEAPTAPPPSEPSGPPGSIPSAGKHGIKQVTVGADAQCPAPQNKSSFFGAQPGKKRCHDQTPGRKH